MNRFSSFIIAVGLSLFLLFWCFFGIVIYIGYGAYGFGVDVYVVIWAIIFLVSTCGVFKAFRRAVKPLQKGSNVPSISRSEADHTTPNSESVQTINPVDLRIEQADEKLAALLGKSKGQEEK